MPAVRRPPPRVVVTDFGDNVIGGGRDEGAGAGAAPGAGLPFDTSLVALQCQGHEFHRTLRALSVRFGTMDALVSRVLFHTSHRCVDGSPSCARLPPLLDADVISDVARLHVLFYPECTEPAAPPTRFDRGYAFNGHLFSVKLFERDLSAHVFPYSPDATRVQDVAHSAEFVRRMVEALTRRRVTVERLTVDLIGTGLELFGRDQQQQPTIDSEQLAHRLRAGAARRLVGDCTVSDLGLVRFGLSVPGDALATVSVCPHGRASVLAPSFEAVRAAYEFLVPFVLSDNADVCVSPEESSCAAVFLSCS
jgi:hypothetical protein